jgi:hypothetical protein
MKRKENKQSYFETGISNLYLQPEVVDVNIHKLPTAFITGHYPFYNTN